MIQYKLSSSIEDIIEKLANCLNSSSNNIGDTSGVFLCLNLLDSVLKEDYLVLSNNAKNKEFVDHLQLNGVICNIPKEQDLSLSLKEVVSKGENILDHFYFLNISSLKDQIKSIQLLNNLTEDNGDKIMFYESSVSGVVFHRFLGNSLDISGLLKLKNSNAKVLIDSCGNKNILIVTSIVGNKHSSFRKNIMKNVVKPLVNSNVINSHPIDIKQLDKKEDKFSGVTRYKIEIKADVNAKQILKLLVNKLDDHFKRRCE